MEINDFTPPETANLKREPIQKGDVVTLVATATYYDGRIIPCWVKKELWYVAQITGDRAVIDKNVSGTHSICSPVNIKYLIKVR